MTRKQKEGDMDIDIEWASDEELALIEWALDEFCPHEEDIIIYCY